MTAERRAGRARGRRARAGTGGGRGAAGGAERSGHAPGVASRGVRGGASREGRAQGGFTLLEVLVAFVIAAMALGVLFEGTVTGLRSVRVSGEYEEALSRAQSHLAALERPGGLLAGSQGGPDGGGFRWRTRVTREAVAPPPDGTPAAARPGLFAPALFAPGLFAPALFAVDVAITWERDGGSREVRLDTQLLGEAAPEPP